MDPAAPADNGQGSGAPVAGAPAQGTAQGGTQTPSESSFDWNLYPGIPEDQREALEPHLKKTQGHVTQLEQRLAPFKAYLEADGGSEALQGLIAFDQAFTADPMATWQQLTQTMISDGALTPEALQSLQFGDQGSEEEDVEAEGEEVNPDIAALTKRMDDRDEADQQRQEEFKAKVSEELLNRQVTRISDTLTKEMGLQVTDENREDVNRTVVAHIIAAGGNPEKALGSMKALIQSSRQALENEKDPKEPAMPNGVPPVNGQTQRAPRNSFDAATQGAKQFMERNRQASVHN